MSELPTSLLLLTNQLHTGGAETWVVAVSRWFATRGVQVTVAAAGGELVARLDPAVRFVELPLKDVRATLPMQVLRVARLVRDVKPQVILANSLVTGAIARLARPRSGVPVLTVAHGWPADRYKLVAPLQRISHRVIAVSAEVERRLVRGGLPPRQVTLVPNGVDLSPFEAEVDPVDRDAARAEMGASKDDLLVINIGRYVTQKAQHRIIEMATMLRGRHPELRWAIVGWGEREAELRELIAAADLGDRVRLLVRRSDVPRLLRASDVFLNVADWEGMPLSMIEAMGAGLPIVATDVEGMTALVGEDNGLLAPPPDVAALAGHVGALAADPALRRRLGDASRARAFGTFSLDRMCEDLARVCLAELRGEPT
jgi:glycosyltransferase involved in cell wall biosynthesis